MPGRQHSRMTRLLTVGRLARAAQVATDTVRYHDAVGLLPAVGARRDTGEWGG